MTDPRVLNLRDYRKPTKYAAYELPEDVVRIDRRSRWGNPYKIGDPDPNGHPMTREQVLYLFRRYAFGRLHMEPQWLEPLRTKRLACWCAPLACHGEILLELLDASQAQSS